LRKLRTALFLILLLVLIAGCGTKTAPAPQPPADTPEELVPDMGTPVEDVVFIDGVYEGVGTGFSGAIYIEVTISGGVITTIEIVDSAETDDVGGMAYETLIAQAKDVQGSDIDGVAGATKTAKGFIEALEDALGQAAQ
jgi:uncharacterized protein with FMN-binding domain